MIGSSAVQLLGCLQHCWQVDEDRAAAHHHRYARSFDYLFARGASLPGCLDMEVDALCAALLMSCARS
jgi:hypothetical protein